MDTSLIPIIYIFIVLVSAYISIGFYKVPSFDVLIIAFALIVLIATMIHGHLMKKTSVQENFMATNMGANSGSTTTTDTSSTYSPNLYKAISLEEDISKIQTKLTVYTTAYNKDSFNENGNTWLNIAAQKSDGTCDTSTSNSMFTFELPPVYSRKSGFYLGNNRIIGPLSNAFKIQYHNTFTFIIACKNGNLLVNNKNDEIELFKFYANSSNNNGLSMYIQKDSLQDINNVQTGNLMFQYAAREPFQCKLQANDDKINFEKDILTFYIVVKDTDHITISTMDEKSNQIKPLLRFNVENTDINFSNKEFVINRLRNWNGNIFTLGVYNAALTSEDIINYYTHTLGEYAKYSNANFIDMIQQYNDTLDMLNKFMSCPYSQSVCTSCSTVNKWNDMSQVLGASTQCRQSINEFCMANINHPLCKCWNNQNAQYKSDTCNMFRGIFNNDKNSYFDTLTQDDIDYIMSKYGLIKPEDCPKAITKPGFLKNKYSEYDYNKLKIYLDEDEKTRVGSVLNVYEQENGSAKPQDEEYTFDKLKVKYDQNMKTAASGKNLTDKDLQIVNKYKNDPLLNYKLDKTAEVTEYSRIKDLTKKDVATLNKTDSLNIIPPDTGNLSAAANPDSAKPSTSSFFDRFMKITFPG